MPPRATSYPNMADQEIKQILLLHPIKFVCESFKSFCEDEGVAVFYLEAPEPFLYLVKDLSADVVVVHESLVDELHDELEGVAINKTPIVVIGNAEGYTCINEPINLSTIASQLRQTLASNS